ARFKEFFNVACQTVQELCPWRLRQSEKARSRLRFPLDAGSEAKILNVAVKEQNRSTRAVAIFDQKCGCRSPRHGADAHAAGIDPNVAWIQCLAAPESCFQKLPAPPSGIAGLPDIVTGEAGDRTHAGFSTPAAFHHNLQGFEGMEAVNLNGAVRRDQSVLD